MTIFNPMFSQTDVLNNFIQEPDGEPPTLADHYPDAEELSFTDFSLEDVVKKLEELKEDKSPGIDQVHLHVLRECKNEMAIPLLTIFQKSLEEGVIPDDWKLARVSPIFKEGPKNVTTGQLALPVCPVRSCNHYSGMPFLVNFLESLQNGCSPSPPHPVISCLASVPPSNIMSC